MTSQRPPPPDGARLKGEQDVIQKRTFTRWLNSHLASHPSAGQLEDLFEDLRDGTQLCNLLEVLTGDKLRLNRGPGLKRVHHLSNLRTALEALKARGLDLVNNNPADIADANARIVLGLVWQIILHFQIEQNARLLAAYGWSISDSLSSSQSSLDSLGLDSAGPSGAPTKAFRNAPLSASTPTGPAKRLRRSATVETIILKWLKKEITERFGLPAVRDLDKSWRDGVLFNALVQRIQPDLVDLESVKAGERRANLEQAFSLAESQLGVPRLLEVDDVDCERPDKRSVLTYVSQFLRLAPQEVTPVGASEEAEWEAAEADGLEEWLVSALATLNTAAGAQVMDFHTEYSFHGGLWDGFRRLRDVHKHFAARVPGGTTTSMGRERWASIDGDWQRVSEGLTSWSHKLLSRLPGELAIQVTWIVAAERFLSTLPPALSAKAHDAVLSEAYTSLEDLHLRAQKHFSETTAQVSAFSAVYRSGRVEGQPIAPEFLDTLQARFTHVSSAAPDHLNDLKVALARLRSLVQLRRLYRTVVREAPESLEQLRKHAQEYQAAKDSHTEEGVRWMLMILGVSALEDAQRAKVVRDTEAELKAMWESVKRDIEPLGKRLISTEALWREWTDEGNRVETWLNQALLRPIRNDSDRAHLTHDQQTWAQHLHKLNSLSHKLQPELGTLAAQSVLVRNQEIRAVWKELNGGRITRWLIDVTHIVTDIRPASLHELRDLLHRLEVAESELDVLDAGLTAETAAEQSRDPAQLASATKLEAEYTQLRRLLPAKARALKLIEPALEGLESKQDSLATWEDAAETWRPTSSLRVLTGEGGRYEDLWEVEWLTSALCAPDHQPHIHTSAIQARTSSLRERLTRIRLQAQAQEVGTLLSRGETLTARRRETREASPSPTVEEAVAELAENEELMRELLSAAQSVEQMKETLARLRPLMEAYDYSEYFNQATGLEFRLLALMEGIQAVQLALGDGRPLDFKQRRKRQKGAPRCTVCSGRGHELPCWASEFGAGAAEEAFGADQIHCLRPRGMRQVSAADVWELSAWTGRSVAAAAAALVAYAAGSHCAVCESPVREESRLKCGHPLHVACGTEDWDTCPFCRLGTAPWSDGAPGMPIVVLSQNTRRESGHKVQEGNIAAAKTIADVIRTSLGPLGTPPPLDNSAKPEVLETMIGCLQKQHDEIGDGTTSVIVLAGQVLAAAQPFLHQKLHPTIIIQAFRQALEDIIQITETKLSKPVDVNNSAEMRGVVESCLGSKMMGKWMEMSVDIAVEAVKSVLVEEDGRKEVDIKHYISCQHIPGGRVEECRVVHGVVLNKDVTHAKMRRHIPTPRIVLLDCNLEYKKGESQTSMEVLWMLHIIALKPDLICTEKGVSDLANKHLLEAGITVLHRLKKTDNNRLARISGARIVNDPADLRPEDVGTRADLFEIQKYADEYYTFITTKDASAKAATVLLRGPSKDVLQEMDRNLADAMAVVRNVLLRPRLCPGGGATEMALASALAVAGLKSRLHDRQWPYRALARALEVIPRTLLLNAGDSTSGPLKTLRAKHAASPDAWTLGVDGNTGDIVDMKDLGIWDPLEVKLQTYKTAIETAVLLLRIDDIVSGTKKANQASEKPANPQAQPDPEMG